MQISSEGKRQKEIQRDPENRLKRGHQQREAIHKGSEKEEEVSRVLSGFFSYVKSQKNSNLFSQSSFDTRFSL